MLSMLREWYQQYSELYEDLADHRTDTWFLLGSPWPVLGICLTYVYFVTSLGPRLMQNRRPFNLDRVMSAYNLLQVALCMYLPYYAYTLGYATSRHPIVCDTIDNSDTPHGLQVALGVYIYFLMKLLDLTDTIFFVLRKKQSQVTFLHVYHHMLMMLTSWFYMKFLPGGQTVFVGIINSMVHVVMYGYYFLTSTWPQYKKSLWWKKHITQLQISQFVLIGLHSSTTLIFDCPYPNLFAVVICVQSVVMVVLFSNFYRRAYLKINTE